MRELTRSFKVLSDETRLRVLKLVSERECCVCEIMQAVDISQSKASRALTALHNAGFLKIRKEGLWSYYSLDTDETAGINIELVNLVVEATRKNRIMLQDKERLKFAKRSNTNCTGCDKTVLKEGK